LEDAKEVRELEVGRGGEGRRLDLHLTLAGASFSRSHVQKLIKDGLVKVNGSPAKASHRLKAGDMIEISIPPKKKLDIAAEKIPLNIIYEDNDLLVINKPHGMVVHPAPGHYEGTLVNALLYHLKDLSGIGGVERPGIVHRLDKDTSGLMMVAKNDKAHLSLSKQIKDRTIEKKYIALVHGKMQKNEGIIDAPIGRSPRHRKKMTVIRSEKLKSKEATTHYRVLERFRNYVLVELKLVTGRTHQIRVHLASIGNPVVGDSVYGRASNEFGIKRQLLHAAQLKFNHPVSGKLMEFKAEPPADFLAVVKKLGS
jgi:23S rRNA pseudouridine1911/1915/1917 synthase